MRHLFSCPAGLNGASKRSSGSGASLSVRFARLFKEAMTPRLPKAGPSRRRAGLRTGAGLVFNPAVFLSTAARGRDISKHAKNELIFAQGDNADSVFYVKKGR